MTAPRCPFSLLSAVAAKEARDAAADRGDRGARGERCVVVAVEETCYAWAAEPDDGELFFYVMFLSTVRTRKTHDRRNSWHSEWWPAKIVLWMGFTVVPFFLPPPLIQLYGKVAHFGAGLHDGNRNKLKLKDEFVLLGCWQLRSKASLCAINKLQRIGLIMIIKELK
uniref:Uncharacterized protein n=2 Tax=Oryza rufipogon TaxID=4529 RepID=A0A0E0PYG1_ORYRU